MCVTKKVEANFSGNFVVLSSPPFSTLRPSNQRLRTKSSLFLPIDFPEEIQLYYYMCMIQTM